MMVSSQVHTCAALLPEKNPNTRWIVGWLGPKFGLDVREKKKISGFCYDLNPGLSSPECSYRGADKSLARPTSQCILFGGENI
jgi:hypothetical protein